MAWLNHTKGGGGNKSKIGSNAEDAIGIDDESNANTSSSDATQRPHLIVVPASVLSNWLNEFKKFAPHMAVVKYHGSLAEREEIQDRLRACLHGEGKKRRFGNGGGDGGGCPEPLDVVLTTFSYFSSEKGDDR